MGHHYNIIVGKGKNKWEAQRSAIDDFLYEEGNRHSVRGIESATLIKRVPPTHFVERKEGQNTIVTSEPNEKAPPSEWLEVWEFELHTHA